MRGRIARVILVALGALGSVGAAAAQATVQEAASTPLPPPPAKEMRASAVPAAAIRVDGRLDEDVWASTAFASDFEQRGDRRGYPPRVRTEVAFAQDGEALYMAARMEGDTRAEARALLGQRDDPGSTERIQVSLDSYQDETTAFTFGVTIGGVRVDYLTLRDREGVRDDSYDPIWTAHVELDSIGWTAEMRIPFSQLRFTPGEAQSWGLNVRRWNPTTRLDVYWVVVPAVQTGWVSRFGRLNGVHAPAAGTPVDLVPYVRGLGTRLDPALGGGPGADTEVRAGADLKIGIRPNLTLDATVNPDFGQVEADPARVNLTEYETFFPERRPFFLEGQRFFRARGPLWFYSRRIGSLPTTGDTERFERIENAQIRGGAKLTGRLASGLSLGALAAVTDRERSAAGDGALVEVAPTTAFAIARVQQEIGPAGSSIGVIGTGVERFFGDDGYLAARLPGRAFSGGLDWTLRFGGGALEVTGFGGGSILTGAPEAMTRVQLSRTHYFQRPDADHVSLDTGADRLTGWTAGLGMARIAGDTWRWSLAASAISPGFDILDAGSMDRADRVDATAELSYGVLDGDGVVRNRRFGVALSTRWNFAGDPLLRMPSGFVSTRWSALASTIQIGMSLPALSDEHTRGGPLMELPRSSWAQVGLSSLSSDRGWWSGDLSATADDAGGWSTTATGGGGVPLNRWLELSLYAGATRADDSRQFTGALDGGPVETFGRRYVFAALERRELFAQMRAKVALAPDAVLTLYAEPFVSAGRARDFGELLAARRGEVRSYDPASTVLLDDGARLVTEGTQSFRIENFDYRVRSFRGTGVFRWEWRGSTLFLIWQKSLWNVGDRWSSPAPSDLIGSLDDPGQDVAAVKLSVRLGLGR